MKNYVIPAAIAAGLSAAVLGLAGPAAAAPSGDGNAQYTIAQLEAAGNRVVVNRLSSTPLQDATVVNVRTGPEIQEYVWEDGRQGDDRTHMDRVLRTVGRVYFVDIR